MGWKNAWQGANGNEVPPVPEKNRGRTGKKTCEPLEQEENHEKGPRRP
jgi:hypothetical protein